MYNQYIGYYEIGTDFEDLYFWDTVSDPQDLDSIKFYPNANYESPFLNYSLVERKFTYTHLPNN
jgi:hypothetical protein